ncbi:MAG TPA: hypothetical protein K8V74_00310, partial [Brevibacterium epidermidis]|nr:hypothetical protein [Brevibacterium epidermidis]
MSAEDGLARDLALRLCEAGSSFLNVKCPDQPRRGGAPEGIDEQFSDLTVVEFGDFETHPTGGSEVHRDEGVRTLEHHLGVHGVEEDQQCLRVLHHLPGNELLGAAVMSKDLLRE